MQIVIPSNHCVRVPSFNLHYILYYYDKLFVSNTEIRRGRSCKPYDNINMSITRRWQLPLGVVMVILLYNIEEIKCCSANTITYDQGSGYQLHTNKIKSIR